MSNKLFQQIGSNFTLPGQFGNIQNLVNQFNQFRSTFRGNPQEQVQQLLNSGRVSQSQYNNAVQLARVLQSMIK